MRQLNEIANNYASENAVDKLKETLAKVYADGYRDGFRDCKEELSVNLRSDKTKYVDLGLPSGTLWASDYETDNSEIYYTTYAKALELNIPSLEQYNELRKFCIFRWDNDDILCIGPNGKFLRMHKTGYKETGEENSPIAANAVFFWIRNNNSDFIWDKYDNNPDNNSAWIYHERGSGRIKEQNKFPGYKLPIRLVKNAQSLCEE